MGISSASVLPLHGEVDTSNSTNKTSSPSVSRLHGEVDTCHGKTSSPSVSRLHGEVDICHGKTLWLTAWPTQTTNSAPTSSKISSHSVFYSMGRWSPQIRGPLLIRC